MKILITGASGLVATELTVLLLETTEYSLTLVSRNPQELSKRYSKFRDRFQAFTLEELMNNEVSPAFDAVVNTAFARNKSGRDVASSLDYTSRLAQWISKGKVGKFINISSQSVYGSSYIPGADENAEVAPGYLYALGKYASEVIVDAWLDHSETHVYNIRLASVCENARFIRIFIERALSGQLITLVAPRQVVSFIDVRDVAIALKKIIEDKDSKGGIYNLGTGESYMILEIVKIIKEIGLNEYSLNNVKIEIDDNGTESSVGMNSDVFQRTFDWTPKYSILEMIRSVFNMLTDVNGGGYPIAFKIVYGLEKI